MNDTFIILITLVLSAFFSGMEIAFVSSNNLRIEIDKSKGLLSGRILSRLKQNPSRFIGALLLGNNVALVIYGKLTPILYLEHYLRRTVNKTLKPLKIERGTYGGFLKLEIVFPDITKAVAFCRIFPKFKEVGHMYIHEFKLNGYKIFRSVGYNTRW